MCWNWQTGQLEVLVAHGRTGSSPVIRTIKPHQSGYFKRKAQSTRGCGFFIFPQIDLIKKRYFRGVNALTEVISQSFPCFPAVFPFSALLGDKWGAKIRKNDIQKTVHRFVGFVNHQAGAFLLPGKFKKDLLRKVKKKNKKLAGMKKGAPNQAAEYFKN